MHQSSFENMRAFRERYLRGREREPLKIIDLGSCDINGSYRPLFNEPKWSYQGVDLEKGPNVDIVLQNPYLFSGIESNSVDVLISGQAFEHIEFFWITMLEIARVLKPGGLCCVIAPSGGYEHRYPVDCWRFYRDGFRALARFSHLQTKEIYTMTEIDCKGFTDESRQWRDTVMICEKPKWSWWQRFKMRTAATILRSLL